MGTVLILWDAGSCPLLPVLRYRRRRIRDPQRSSHRRYRSVRCNRLSHGDPRRYFGRPCFRPRTYPLLFRYRYYGGAHCSCRHARRSWRDHRSASGCDRFRVPQKQRIGSGRLALQQRRPQTRSGVHAFLYRHQHRCAFRPGTNRLGMGLARLPLRLRNRGYRHGGRAYSVCTHSQEPARVGARGNCSFHPTSERYFSRCSGRYSSHNIPAGHDGLDDYRQPRHVGGKRGRHRSRSSFHTVAHREERDQHRTLAGVGVHSPLDCQRYFLGTLPAAVYGHSHLF